MSGNDFDIEVVQGILDDILSGDRRRIGSGSCAVVALRDKQMLTWLSQHIDDVRQRTEGVELGGVHPNSAHLRTAILKLQIVRDEKECLCQLYPGYLMFEPEKLEAAGDVDIEDPGTLHGISNREYRCRCKQCGKRYLVEEGEYHYMWWQWRPMPD